jgi:hypothetical protein
MRYELSDYEWTAIKPMLPDIVQLRSHVSFVPGTNAPAAAIISSPCRVKYAGQDRSKLATVSWN